MGTSCLKVVYRPVLLIVWLLIIFTSVSAIPLRKTEDILEKPAYALAGQSKQLEIVQTTIPVQQQNTNQIKDSGWPWWYWAMSAIVVGVIGASLLNRGGSSSGDSSSGNSCPSGEGTCGSTTFTW